MGEYFDAAAYLGVLFVAGAGTVGLPAFHEEEWEVSGTISLLLEGGFLLAAAAAVLPARRLRPPS